MRRVIASLLVCLLVCMSGCSPALAASTTDSQIMIVSDDEEITPFVLGDSDNPISCSIAVDLYNSFLQNSVASFSKVDLGTLPNTLDYSGNIGFVAMVFPDNINDLDFDQVRVSYFFKLQNNSWFSNVPMNIQFGRLFLATWNYNAEGDRLFPMSGLKKVTYQIQRGTSYSNSYFTSETSLGNAVSGSNPAFFPSDVTFASQIPFNMSFVGSTTTYDYGFCVHFYFDKSTIDFNANEFRVGFGHAYYPYYSAIPNMNFFSFKPLGTVSSSQQGQQTEEAIKETTSAINNLSSAMSSAFSDLSAQMGQISSAINSAMQTMVQQLQQQTEVINNMVTQQIQQIRQDLGLVNDSISSGFTQAISVISNQTTQITGKIDSLQQHVTNKLDTVNQSITDLQDTTKHGFNIVEQGIKDLPGKIGEMLQGLIVPDSDKVSGKFSDFNDLAEEKLGVIYQVPEMMFSMANSVVSGAVEQKGEMTLPKFEIIMPATNQSRAGERLTVWEEYTFQIWPEGTEVIHTAVQTATSMICVILTFNALKRKYEDWLDGK